MPFPCLFLGAPPTQVIHDVMGVPGGPQLFDLPPLPQLAALAQLQRLHYAVYAAEECPGGLPAGALQAGVQRLALEERLLHACAAWLEGAAALEELHVK